MTSDNKISEYISFLNSLDLSSKFLSAVEIEDRVADSMMGWKGIKSLECITDKKELCDVNIRFAWSGQIFRQHLYDFGWDRFTLLYSDRKKSQFRHKYIIYLCSPSVNLTDRIQHIPVPDEFLIGKYWTRIDRLYLSLPCQHPFNLPELDSDISKDLDSYLSFPTATLSKDCIAEGGLRTKGINKNGTIDRPLVSVITIVFNGEKNLEQTIQSVINQDSDNFEYIIVDGGSSDRTLEIVKKYESQIDYWISEKDRGIYDAMNKGINLAHGQWLSFMNCADLFYSCKSLSGVPLKADVDFYYSDSILYNIDKDVQLHYCSQPDKVFIHQSIVYKKDIHKNTNYLVYDNLTISDYLFFRQNDTRNWIKLDLPLSIYNTDGITSNTSTQFAQYLFVNFIRGDISELKMSFMIINKNIKDLLKIILSWFDFSKK
jgi:hypothetical protein